MPISEFRKQQAKSKKVTIVTCYDKKILIGVEAKYEELNKALKEEGSDAHRIHENNYSVKSAAKIVLKCFKLDGVVHIRSLGPLTFFLLPNLLYWKLKGVKARLEVPTPVSMCVNEIAKSKKLLLRKVLIISLYFLQFPWLFLLFERVFQYAPETGYWNILSRIKRFSFISNYIDTKSVNFIKRPLFLGQSINLCCIGNLSYWHGYDLLIKSLSSKKVLNTGGKELSINVHIVGMGAEYKALKELALSLGLQEQVVFHGLKYESELDEIINYCDIGVCSLALYRRGLNVASELKARKYLAHGLPIIYTSDDEALRSLTFAFQVPNLSNALKLTDAIEYFLGLSANGLLSSTHDVRESATPLIDFHNNIEMFT